MRAHPPARGAAALRPAAPPLPVPDPAAPDPEIAAILLVDDREDQLAALEASLEDLGDGVELVRARSGREALRQVLKREFAAVLLDVHMPVMDGFETAALIRQRRRSAHTPILFVTALGPSETQVTRGYSLGAVDYIFAPVVPEVLRAKVTVFIDLHRKTAKVRRQGEWLRAEAERRAAVLETRLRGMMERLEVGVFRATPEGRILEANPAFLKLTGRSSVAEAAAAGLGGLFPGGAVPPAAGAGDRSARDLRLNLPDGTARWVTLSTAGVRESDGGLVVDGIVEDVSARKRAEARLVSAHEALERQARDLARSNADLRRFASAVSHDLQEPLRQVATFLEVLGKEGREGLDEDGRRYVDYAREGVERMRGMVRGLLDFCVLETTAGRRRPTDAGAVLDEVLAGLRIAMQESEAEVVRTPLPVVEADGVQLAHVFQNLVSNALKFRRPGGRARVRVDARREGNEVVFSVADNGVGIDPASSDRLFQVFQRLPGSEGIPGSGLGLALCKRLVERNGGRIWTEPSPEGGATFLFSLPAAAEGAP